jgi:hypothetical protein
MMKIELLKARTKKLSIKISVSPDAKAGKSLLTFQYQTSVTII